MKNENQQREVSSCCGAEVRPCVSTDCKRCDYFCSNCKRHCEGTNHIFQTDKMVREEGEKWLQENKEQPTPEETHQTGSEGWEEDFDEKFSGYVCEVSEGNNVYHVEDASPIKQFIRDLLAAQKGGMECKHDKPTLHVPSETISMEDHNKQIIDAVERFASDIRFSNDELIGLGNDLVVKACLKFNQRIDAYLPEFKREYGGKE